MTNPKRLCSFRESAGKRTQLGSLVRIVFVVGLLVAEVEPSRRLGIACKLIVKRRLYIRERMTSILRELMHHLSVPTLYDQSFGLGLDVIPNSPPASALSPLWSLVRSQSNINEKHEFQVSLDVQQFKPEELSVKVKEGSVVVEGKHEEKRDVHGFISRQFTRRYQLPETVDSNALQASLSSDGVLQLSVPLRMVQGVNIPIIKTNKTAAALNNGSCETATVNGDSKSATVNGDTKTATVNGDMKTATVNGDMKTATVNGDSNAASPKSSPIQQPASKKPRIEVDN